MCKLCYLLLLLVMVVQLPANCNPTAVPSAAVVTHAPPTITPIADQTLNTGSSTPTLAFSVGDSVTQAAALTVTGTSSNAALVSSSAIVLTAPNAAGLCAVTLTPVAGKGGTATITLAVKNGYNLTATTSFMVTVYAPPTITSIANQTIAMNATSRVLAFTVGDSVTPAVALTVLSACSNLTLIPMANIRISGAGAVSRSVTFIPVAGQSGLATITLTVSVPSVAPLMVTGLSSNTTLVPIANIVFAGAGASRSVVVTPATGHSGVSTITLTVTDGGGLTQHTSFLVSVYATPTITPLANQSITTGASSAALPFTVYDSVTPATAMQVTGSSSNTTLIPSANVAVTGPDVKGNCSVTVTPVAGKVGTATITLSVKNGDNMTASTRFVITVTAPVITAPTVTINQAIGQADPTMTTPIHFTVVFNRAVTGFAAGKVTLSGSAPGTGVSTLSGSGTSYDVAVSGMTGSGTVSATLAAGAAHDVLGMASAASTSTDNTVTYIDVLGSTASFAAFGGNAGITNQGITTVITGNIGTTGASTTVTGFHDATGDSYTETPLNIGTVSGRIYTAAPPPVVYAAGGPYGGNAATASIAQAAAADALAAYTYLAGLSPTAGDPSASGELSGLTLTPGVYRAGGGAYNLLPGGTLTLDAQGDVNAVWIFQMGSSLNVGAVGAGATPAVVVFKDGIGSPKNVYWQVGSAATINTGATMQGTIIAYAGITFSTAGQVISTTLDGRALSLNASVTMVDTHINVP